MKKLSVLAFATLSAVGLANTQLICKLNPGADPYKIALRYHIPLLDRSYVGSAFALYGVPSNRNADNQQALMQADPDLAWVEDDDNLTMPETTGKGSTIGAVGDGNALYTQNQGLFKQINWTNIYAQKTGRQVRVAVLDTGLSPNQPALWNRTVGSVNLVEIGQKATDLPRNEDSNGNGVVDEATGHGTMVAGIINQVAPKAQLVIIRVADSDGHATAWRIIKGLTLAVAYGCEVANISLGSQAKIVAMSDVLDWTEANNLLICAPLGNDNQNLALFPAGIHNALSVAGVDPVDKKASFSNWEGLTLACAPATGVKSYWWDGTLGIWSGTSFASPFVAGVIADGLRQISSPLTPQVLRNLAKSSGDSVDLKNPSYKAQLGTRLNALKLESAIINSSKGGGGP